MLPPKEEKIKNECFQILKQLDTPIDAIALLGVMMTALCLAGKIPPKIYKEMWADCSEKYEEIYNEEIKDKK